MGRRCHFWVHGTVSGAAVLGHTSDSRREHFYLTRDLHLAPPSWGIFGTTPRNFVFWIVLTIFRATVKKYKDEQTAELTRNYLNSLR